MAESIPSRCDILLTTINARYIHTAFGLRYLYANMEDLQERTAIVEWTIKDHPLHMVEQIVARTPVIVGLGVYIWNIDVATQVVLALKALRPELVVILGGPEVSYEWHDLPIVAAADYVITGEADLAFAALCRRILAGDKPPERVIQASLPATESLQLPYATYQDEDIQHRVIYVEASRGCPFRCEFCLSSLDIPVRQFPIEPFLQEMLRLYERGVQQFKFVDRTFNLNLRVSERILRFFAPLQRPGLFLHFEMIPDRFPEALQQLVCQFPPGVLQFEVGIQTFNEEVAARISRRQDNRKIEDNLTFLRTQTGVHVHADLIVGLPGESLESFAQGFDRLYALGPQEIQVGILKRLRGTPIARHSQTWGMVFHPNAPYEIMQNNDIDFFTMQRLRRFSQLWDRYANSGYFLESLPKLWRDSSPFWEFWAFSSYVVDTLGQSHSISLDRLGEQLWLYLTQHKHEPEEEVSAVFWRDWTRSGRLKIPAWLKPHTKAQQSSPSHSPSSPLAGTIIPSRSEQTPPVRQVRHIITPDPDNTAS